MSSTESSLSRSSLILLVTGLITFGMGFSLVFAILPPIGRELGFDEIQVGAIFAVGAVFLFFCAPFWGRKSDVWGRKPVLMVGFLGYTITQLAFVIFVQLGLNGLMHGLLVFFLLLLSRAAFAATVSAVNAPAAGYIADTTSPQDRTARLSWINASFGIGSMIGPGIGALLTSFGILVPLYAICGWAFVMALMIWFFLPEPARSRPTAGSAVKLHLTDRRVLPIALLTTGSFLTIAANMQLAAFYVQDRLHLDTGATSQAVGALLTVMAMTALGTQLFIIRRFALHPSTLMAIGMPIGALSLFGVTVTETLEAFMAFFALLGIAIGLVGPALSGAASLAVSAEEQGGVAGIIEAGRAIGFFVASMGGSALYNFGPQVPYALITGVLVVMSIYAYVLWRRHRHQAVGRH